MSSVAALVALIVCWCALSSTGKGQEVNCPYFQYLNYGGEYIGKITLPITQAVTDLNVKFSQRNPISSNYFGNLTLYDDEETTKDNIRNGRPVLYRVNFPTAGVLPRLVSLQLNGAVICSGSDYPPPNNMINLTHTLRSTTIVYNPINNASPGGTVNYVTVHQPQQQPAIVQRVQNEIDHQTSDVETSFFKPSSQQTTIRSQPQPQPKKVTKAPTTLVRLSSSSPDIRQPTRGTSDNFECGIEGNTIPLVHGGVRIPRGRYPWMAAIYHKESTNLNFKCGGSLVSEQIVITAAHCVDGKREHEILVWLGRHDLNSYNENGTVSRDVQSIRQHHEYNVGVMPDADIAMLTLKLPVFYSSFIKPICIWGADQPIAIRPNERGLIAGWGTDELGNTVTRYPKSVEETIVDEATCLRSLLVPDLTSDRTLCAGNKDGTGPCYGDSGGGLMIKRNGRWLLRAVVSAGLAAGNQCNLGEYVVYCDLAKHMDWVLKGLK